MDYRDTVILPHTPFPMKADLLDRQEFVLRRWLAQDLHRALLEDRRDAEPFIIHDGPPYASGQMHVGIGLNKVLKDTVAKFHAMNDRWVPFVPGWDCHGLPIEQEVRKELAASGEERSAAEIRVLCEEHALRYVEDQRNQFQRLGVFADWNRPYLTLSPAYEAGVLSVLLKLVEKGYVSRGLRPLAWCPSCRTTLADVEVDHRTVEGSSLWLYFDGGPQLAARFGISGRGPVSALVWTTTPWTLPGNVAVAAHPNETYAAFQLEDSGQERVVVLLEQLAGEAFSALGVGSSTKLGAIAGRELEGVALAHPLQARSVPVVLSETVNAESGSGFVHIAPGHGDEDLEVARQHDLPVTSPLDDDGRFTSEAGDLAGMPALEAGPAVVEALTARGTLGAAGRIEHEYPHCGRCERPILTRATSQWFVGLDHVEPGQSKSLRQRALVEVDVTQWLPSGSRERIRAMIEARPDWCISRQRSWGVPLPAFTCRGCGGAVLDPNLIRRVRDVIGERGSEAWFELAARDLLPPGFTCAACGSADLEKGGDVLDVWFESGASWQSVLVADYRLRFPADLYLEGHDQHRGWFQLSLLLGVAVRGEAPFRTTFTHGFVLNQERRRMSRFQGDLVTLADALQEVPADLIRLYFLSADPTADLPLSLDRFATVEPIYRTLRNTFRFLLGALHDYLPREHVVHLDDLHPLDRWALCRFHDLVRLVTEDYAAFRFHGVIRRIHDYANEDLSQLYLDVLKDRLYCETQSSQVRRSAQTVLHSILMGLVKQLAPVLPYTTEEIWDLAPGHGDCASVHLSRWPKVDEGLLHSARSMAARESFDRFLTLKAALDPELERLRGTGAIGKSTEAALRLYADGGLAKFVGVASIEDLRSFLLVAEVQAADQSADLQPVPHLPGVAIGVEAALHPECPRCRRRDATCASDPRYPDLCSRCARVMGERAAPPPRPSLVSGLVEPSVRPADLARFLRIRGIRKVAVLNEDGSCRPWALHAPSQEVRLLEELQPLADYINRSADFRDHAAVLLGLGEHTDVLFGIGIHKLSYGTPLGGTREFVYPQVSKMIDNLLRLSWGMSFKNAVAELPYGGGKSIIDTCGLDLRIHRELRREVYRDFGQFTASLFGRYICAEDMNNTNADTREMLAFCRHTMCLSQGVGGSGNPSRFTALAAWAAAKAGWRFLTGSTSFAGLSIALQGCGNVATNLVAILMESDPDLASLIVADRDPERIQAVQNFLIKRDRRELLKVVSSKDSEQESQDSYVEREDEAGKGYILYTPCDILVPVAVGNVVNPHNAEQLSCRMIVPIANNVYSSNDDVSVVLHRRGILDVVENNVNWGGAMAAASELMGYDERNVAQAAVEAYEKTSQLLVEAAERNVPPWHVLQERVRERVFGEVHPAVSAARGYRFIGDISSGIAAWIKNRWLTGIVDVSPDDFPAFSLSVLPESHSARTD